MLEHEKYMTQDQKVQEWVIKPARVPLWKWWGGESKEQQPHHCLLLSYWTKLGIFSHLFMFLHLLQVALRDYLCSVFTHSSGRSVT